MFPPRSEACGRAAPAEPAQVPVATACPAPSSGWLPRERQSGTQNRLETGRFVADRSYVTGAGQPQSPSQALALVRKGENLTQARRQLPGSCHMSNSDAAPSPGLLHSHGAHPGQERRWRSGDSVCELGTRIKNTCRLLCRCQSAVLCSALQGCYPASSSTLRTAASDRPKCLATWVGATPATRAARTALRCPSCSGEEVLADLGCRSWRVEPETRCLSAILARCTAVSTSGGRPLPFSSRRCTSSTSRSSCWAS